MTEIEIPVKKIDDVMHTDICGLKKIVESIEAFDNGEWRPWNHVSAVLKFLGASTVSKDYKEKGYEGLGIESEFLHPDEILVAVYRHLEKKEKLSYQDMPHEAHRWMASPRISAFEIMENAKNGTDVKIWQEEGLPSDMGYHYSRHMKITETIFGLYKVQCLWQKDDGPWQIGGDHKFKEIGYRVLMA